jgi:hypothetical protein
MSNRVRTADGLILKLTGSRRVKQNLPKGSPGAKRRGRRNRKKSLAARAAALDQEAKTVED